ncbi:DUF6607 family protein [Algiphilus sp.]|uniref:DUF6607 family protein n=1 Tax=Algiphilus sp. TaxID=1872431 RepID=UPI0025BE83CD|nr:DUF6607 family protein [Algiphilus sp.]MCK5771107.1 hypothetical protein [Algiphilus sp.]
MPRPLLAAACAALLISGCAAVTERPQSGGDAASAPDPRDRKAILDMAGEFEVRFRFDETLSLRSGYQLREPQRSGGHELVLVIADTPRHVALQHILVMDGHVVKHWRQDWHYQRTTSWTYAGDRTWERVTRAPETVRGTWTQTVWQVDDSPRYAGTGRWRHAHGVSIWTSGETRRPLPRRERTSRDDYDLLLGINRHIITPWGWAHEQDNTKVDRTAAPADRAVVREAGLNRYRRITDHDFSPGRDYWTRTRAYWAEVREVWRELLADRARVPMAAEVDGKRLFQVMFEQADQFAEAPHDGDAMRRAARDAILGYVRAADN